MTDESQQTLANLRRRCGKATPKEKLANETNFSAGWNPADQIEVPFSRLEECFLFAEVAKPEYTKEQMVDKAITCPLTDLTIAYSSHFVYLIENNILDFSLEGYANTILSLTEVLIKKGIRG